MFCVQHTAFFRNPPPQTPPPRAPAPPPPLPPPPQPPPPTSPNQNGSRIRIYCTFSLCDCAKSILRASVGSQSITVHASACTSLRMHTYTVIITIWIDRASLFNLYNQMFATNVTYNGKYRTCYIRSKLARFATGCTLANILF